MFEAEKCPTGRWKPDDLAEVPACREPGQLDVDQARGSDESKSISAATTERLVDAVQHRQICWRGDRCEVGTDGTQFGDELLLIGAAD